MRTFEAKFVEKIKTHISGSITSYSDIRAVMTKCGKNNVEAGRPQMTPQRMCIEFWTPRATKTHSEYVIIIAFSLQQ